MIRTKESAIAHPGPAMPPQPQSEYTVLMENASELIGQLEDRLHRMDVRLSPFMNKQGSEPQALPSDLKGANSEATCAIYELCRRLENINAKLSSIHVSLVI